jgi:hypothetical protein
VYEENLVLKKNKKFKIGEKVDAQGWMNCYCVKTEGDKNRKMNKICKNKVAPIRKTLEYYSYVLPVLTAVINFLGTTALAKLG